MTELQPGSVFAGHRIDGVVGRGGMGVVYRATHLALERQVALKVITPDLAAEAGFRERFQRESRIAAALDHPHVIAVHHAGEEAGVLFITMRLVDGEDLGALLKREGRMQPRRAATIVGQIAEALDAAHARGLVHRDVKPANVLVAGDHVFLTDFGLTKRDTSTVSLTRTGEIVGTLDYIAPEQIRGEAVDARTDVYALGCMLFHLVTGSVPFPADVHAAKVYAHLTGDTPSVTALAPQAPRELDAVVRRAMEKDPERRFQTAGELGAAALAAVDAGSATAARSVIADAPETAARPVVAAEPAPTEPGVTLAPERSTLRRLAPALIALAIGVAIAAGVLLGRGSGADSIPADDVRATLDRYQASLTNGDVAGLERLLAPDFTRQLLAGDSIDRDTALDQYSEGFDFRGDQRRYSLSDVEVFTGSGGASATARYEFTGTPEPHLGDYGSVRFQLAESDGRVLIERVESYPDVLAFLPESVGPEDYPITVRLTATTRSDGETVTIADAETAVPSEPDAVKLPLNETGRRVLEPNQTFRARTTIELADGTRLTDSYRSHFAASLDEQR